MSSRKKCKRVASNTANVGNDNGVIPVGTIVWKAAHVPGKKLKRPNEWGDDIGVERNVIVKLFVTKNGVVPHTARCLAVSDDSRKCRIPEGIVLGIFAKKSTEQKFENIVAESDYDPRFKYKLGTKVSTKYNGTPSDTCTSGIHCFRTRAEAERYF